MLDRAEEQRFLDAMLAVGFGYDSATRGFRKGPVWVTYDQALDAWLAAERGEQLEAGTISPASETMARTVGEASNDQ